MWAKMLKLKGRGIQSSVDTYSEPLVSLVGAPCESSGSVGAVVGAGGAVGGGGMYRSATSPQLVLVPRMTQVCQECGCACGSCLNNSLDLHQEIEDLRSKLNKSSAQVMHMEREFAESSSYAEAEVNKLQDELAKLRDRYDRLFESQKKLQKLNHNLEDKLLANVHRFEDMKNQVDSDLQKSKHELLDAKITISQLEEDCERYRSDCNIAVQLLQCKPSTFVSHKLDVLPVELQQRLRGQLSKEQQMSLEGPPADCSPRMIKVPMATFPPTAMVYSVPPTPPPAATPDTVPMSLIARVLAQPEPRHRPQRLVICPRCSTAHSIRDRATQAGDGEVAAASNGWRTAVLHGGGGGGKGGGGGRHYGPGVHRPQRANSAEAGGELMAWS